MSVFRTSRELAERVEIEFHKRPNRFRRLTWTVAVLAGILSSVWLAFESARGEHHIFEAGPLSTAHKMFENDCAKCHNSWSPLERFVTLDNDIRAVDNKKCQACHDGPTHHEHQRPAHKSISCAKCHREHHGNELVARLANQHCIDCHADLPAHGGKKTFVATITGYEKSQGHPEFAIHRLMQSESVSAKLRQRVKADSIIDQFQRDGEPQSKWQDASRIKFNHAAHLKSEYDEAGKLVYGLIGKNKQFTDLSKSCQTCHQPDADRAYMRPIRYEKHCASCHPLLFDNQQFPGKSVPHESPNVVRGYLTELYTLKALQQTKQPPAQPSDQQATRRQIPGRHNRDLLNPAQAEWLQARVTQAEQSVQQHAHTMFGYEARGGCRYCHSVEESPDDNDWKIVPPRIPDRWLPHSRFRHDSHRLLTCVACHQNAGKSKSTGDVLMPSIQVCRKCHSSTPHQSAAAASGRVVSARTDCVECHNYHKREDENFDGPFNANLEPVAKQPDATPSNESSN